MKRQRCVVYARVSSADQKDDLDRQVGRVVDWATRQGHRPDEVVKEVGSGLNGNRPRLRRLVADHTVRTIVVEQSGCAASARVPGGGAGRPGSSGQLCVATLADDGTLTLRLRLPDCLAGEHGKYLTISGVRFAHGQEQALAALQSNAEFSAYRRKYGEKAARGAGLGQAISYR